MLAAKIAYVCCVVIGYFWLIHQTIRLGFVFVSQKVLTVKLFCVTSPAEPGGAEH